MAERNESSPPPTSHIIIARADLLFTDGSINATGIKPAPRDLSDPVEAAKEATAQRLAKERAALMSPEAIADRRKFAASLGSGGIAQGTEFFGPDQADFIE